MALEPATEEVLAAMPDAVQPSRGRGKPGEQSNHAARVLFQPRIQLPGRGDLGPLIVGRKSQRFGETQVGLSPVSGQKSACPRLSLPFTAC
jgi:hypothetical protein